MIFCKKNFFFNKKIKNYLVILNYNTNKYLFNFCIEQVQLFFINIFQIFNLFLKFNISYIKNLTKYPLFLFLLLVYNYLLFNYY